jgi:tripartite-type tricarboxylate transporter receptor subunit TctC
VHVPYRGDPPGLTDAMAGQVPLVVVATPSALPFVKSGKLRALAVTSKARAAPLPDVPTVAEQGFPGFEVIGWVGVLVPKGTPAPIVARIVREFTAVMSSDEIRRKADVEGWFVPTLGPDYFARFIHAEATRWRELITSLDIKPE